MLMQFAIFVISVVITIASRTKPPAPKPAAFEDFQFPQADEGTPQAVIFGDVWIEDWTVVGVGNYRTEPIIR